MDVTCERCQTEYEFDETLISDRGTTVKCTHCGHLFKIFRTGGSGQQAAVGGSARVWTLRRHGGETLTFDRLATLQQWILDGRVEKRDEISRTGETWKELGTIAELATFFAAAGKADGAKTVEYQSLDDAPTQSTKEPTHKGLAPQPPPGRGKADAARVAKSTILGVAPTGAAVVPPPPPSPPASPPPTPSAAQGAVIGRAVSPTLETATTLRSKPEGAPAVEPPPPPGPSAPRPTPLASPPPPVLAPPPARPVAAPPPAAPPPARPVAPSAPRPAPAAPAAAVAVARIAPPRATPATREPTPPPVTRAAPERAAAAPVIAQPPAAPDAPRDSFDSGLMPAVAVVEPSGDVGSVRPSMGGQPAWATAAASLGAVPDEAQQQGSSESVAPPVVRRSNRTLGILLMAGVLVVIVVGIGVFAGPGVASFFGGAFSAPPPAPPQEDRAGVLVEQGRQTALSDREQDLDAAIATFHQALGASPEDPRALSALGETMALQAQSRRDEAVDLEEKARRLRPSEGTDPEVARAELQARAKVLRESVTAKVAEAREFAERAVRAAPELPAAQRARADVLRLSGDLPGARTALAQALARDASSPENRYASAMLALESPETKPQARVDLREAILSNPRMVRAILQLARLDALEGDVASARAGARRALELQPEHARARALLAAIDAGEPPVVPVEIAMGQTPTALDGGVAPATPDAGTTAPPPNEGQNPGGGPAPSGGRSPDWFVGEGERLMRNGQAEQARRAFEQALSLQPGRSEALAGLGFVLLSLGDARGAMTQFRRLLDSNPSYAAGYYGMGQAAQRLGQTSVAVQNYRRFLESSSTGPRAEAARRFLESVEGQGGGSPPDPPPPDEGGTPPPDQGTAPPDDGTSLPAPRDMAPGTTPPSDRPAPESEPPGLPPVTQ